MPGEEYISEEWLEYTDGELCKVLNYLESRLDSAREAGRNLEAMSLSARELALKRIMLRVRVETLEEVKRRVLVIRGVTDPSEQETKKIRAPV